MPNSFCALPFGHTTIDTSGNFLVCCLHRPPIQHTVNINSDAINKWLQSEYLDQVRQSFIDGQQHPGCITCWHSENQGHASMRNRTAKEYQLLGVSQADRYPVNIEVQLGNLCNLKCLMCNENSSSAILSENIQLGINKFDQKDFQWQETGFENLKKIIAQGPKVLNIRGGEPFYNKQFLSILEELPAESCRQTLLHVTTNATRWNEQWKEVIQKFKLVRIMFSIDGVDDLYEYIRYPASWEQVKSNIDSICSLKNVRPLVNCTVQNLNIGSIGSVINWCKEKNLYLQLEQLINPTWLHISNLPVQLKTQAVNHLDNVLTYDLSDYLKQQISSYRTQLITALNQPDNFELWNLFKSQITLRDQLRNNSYTKFLTE
jgi:MoaA/NifB/PqqE/SkfB family radical SAM enzyme